jgi:cell wall-associated NlpC family hydrolase
MGSVHAAPVDQDSAKESLLDSKRLTDADGLGVLERESLANRIFPEQIPSGTPEEDLRASAGAGLDLRASAGAELANLVKQATKMIGIPCLWGGNNPEEGLDCSGFVRYVYHKTTGLLQISRTRRAVAQSDLHPGDLAFFDTPRGPATHVGIYMGGQRFIHAPKTGVDIRVESLNSPYWASRYHGARRFAA